MRSKICDIRKRLSRTVLLLGLISLAALPAGLARAAHITSQQVRDGLYLFQGAGCNVVALADGKELLIIDGGLQENSRDLLSAIRKATGGQKINTLIDTDYHAEEVGLNEQAGREGATIIAHEETLMFLSHKVASPLFKGSFGPLDKRARPNKTTRTGGEMTFAGHKVEYGYLPAAHTNGDLYVFFPDLNVLVAGGAVGSNSWPLLDYWNGAFIGGLVRAHEKLADMVKDDTIVVTGQGPTIAGATLKQQRDMYDQLFRDFNYMMNKGMGFNDVVAINPLHGHEGTLGDPSKFLDGAYRSMEMAYVPE